MAGINCASDAVGEIGGLFDTVKSVFGCDGIKALRVAVNCRHATVLIRSVKKEYAVFVGQAGVVISGAAVRTVSPVVTYISRISEKYRL